MTGSWYHGDCVWVAGGTIRVKRQIVVFELVWVVDTVQLAENLVAKEIELEARMIAFEVVSLHKEAHPDPTRVDATRG